MFRLTAIYVFMRTRIPYDTFDFVLEKFVVHCIAGYDMDAVIDGCVYFMFHVQGNMSDHRSHD